ncbi:MAG: zinc ribbon domain-containing protein [Clostridia bacterium]|nr:zinc ribbon domain-containing protein [Clostridia bacterium]
MGKLVMGYWDCPYCQYQGISGDQGKCPQCGRPRGDVKFYMKGYAEGQTREENERGDIEYLDEEKAKYVNRNPDWYCSYCNTLNSDNAEKCSNCGATRADSEANYFDQLKKRQQQQQQSAQAQQAQQRAPEKGGSKKWLIFLAVAAIAIFGIVKFMSGNTTQGDLKVTRIEWARSINIEQNIQYSESGWTLPAGAELTAQKEEVHHYDTVLDHYQNVQVERSREVLDHYETYYTYKDMGNGYFEEVANERPIYKTEYYTETVQQPVYRQVPRYQTKYYYTIWRWTPARDVKATGDDHNAQWPEVTLRENEREGQRTEAYAFQVVNEKKNTTAAYQLSEADWRNIKVGDNLFITARRTGSGAFISDKDGNKIADIVQIK